jgi:methylglutaconyl-CoA hydratase
VLAEETAQLLARLRVTPEGREGLSAFLERRKPNWQGE